MSVHVCGDWIAAKLEEKQRQPGSAHAGVLLGARTGQSTTVLRMVRTPDGMELLDTAWHAAHAKTLDAMTPGGIEVCGAFVFGTSAKLASLESKAIALLAAIGKMHGDNLQGPMLLLLPSDAKKPTWKVLASSGNRLQPLDVKLTSSMPQLHCFASNWKVDTKFALKNGAQKQVEQLKSQASRLGGFLRDAVVAVDASVPAPDATVGQLGRQGSLERPHEVAFYSRQRVAVPSAASGAEGDPAECAWLRVRGVLHGRVFALSKDAVADVIELMCKDLTLSLETRLSLLLEDEAEEAEAEGEEDEPERAEARRRAVNAGAVLELDVAKSFALPRRAHVRLDSGFSVCDYVSVAEEPMACAERFNSLMALDLPEEVDSVDLGEVLGPEFEIGVSAPQPSGPAETTPIAAASHSLRDDDIRDGQQSQSLSDESPKASSMNLVLPAAAAAMVAIAAATVAALSLGGGEES